MEIITLRNSKWLAGIAISCLLGGPMVHAADDGAASGGKHDKHSAKSEDAGGGGHSGHSMKHGDAPGTVKEMCHDHEGMPPHYCEPVYKVASSAKGVRISTVEISGDQELMVTLDEMNAMAPGVSQSVALVGGAGDLAGAVVVKSGWKNSNTVHIKFSGAGTVYEQKKIHLHLFPLTSQ